MTDSITAQRLTHRAPWIIALGLGAAAVLAVGLYLGTHSAANEGTNQAVAATTVPTLTPTETLVGELNSWYAEGGRARLSAIAADGSLLGQASSPDDVLIACQSMQADVESLQHYRPLPDASMQEPLSRAMSHYARFTTNCIASIQTGSLVLLERSRVDITQAGTAMAEATAALTAAQSSD